MGASIVSRRLHDRDFRVASSRLLKSAQHMSVSPLQWLASEASGLSPCPLLLLTG